MYSKTTLSNKLRVVTCELKDRDSVALGFWVGAGGRYENDRQKGVAHFLEHIAFKGSRKYSCNEIKQRIEGIGGAMNAFTSEEQTCYYAKIPAKHLAPTFDVLADMVFYPRITKSDVDKERTVILEEIKMYHDLPQYYVIELLDQLVWPNHPLGKNLAGNVETVSNLTEKNLQTFHKEFYPAENIVVAACGRLKHETVVKLATQFLKGFPVYAGGKDFVKAPNRQVSPKVNFYQKNTEQMHLALGMLSCDEYNKDRYAVGLLNILLGGNMSSRLFNEVREKRGLAYSIGSSAKALKDTGIFMVRAGVDNQKIVKAVDVILKELDKISQIRVSDDEFKRGREYVIGQMLLSMEETMDQMLWIGEETISRNKIRTIKEVINHIKKVTPADIKRVAGEIFKGNHYNLAIIGSLSEGQQASLKKLLKV